MPEASEVLVAGSGDVVGEQSLLGTEPPGQLSAVTVLPNSS